MPSCAQGCMLVLSAESALMWTQGNKVAQDVGGLIDIILSNAMSLANSMPDITNPLAALGNLRPPSIPYFSPFQPNGLCTRRSGVRATALARLSLICRGTSTFTNE